MALREALFGFLWIFGVPLGSEWAPFWRKKASFLGSLFLMVFWCDDSIYFGGVGGSAEPLGVILHAYIA